MGLHFIQVPSSNPKRFCGGKKLAKSKGYQTIKAGLLYPNFRILLFLQILLLLPLRTFFKPIRTMSNLSFAPSSTHLCSAFSGLGKKCVIREKQNHLVTLPLVSLRSPWRMSFNESNYSPVSNNIRSSKVFDSVFEAIGNTPLIKLRRASDESGCNVYGKAEFMNPVSSIF